MPIKYSFLKKIEMFLGLSQSGERVQEASTKYLESSEVVDSLTESIVYVSNSQHYLLRQFFFSYGILSSVSHK